MSIIVLLEGDFYAALGLLQTCVSLSTAESLVHLLGNIEPISIL